jgi:hypothetical protein
VKNPRIVIVNLPTYLDIRGHKAKVLEAKWKILELASSALSLTLTLEAHKAKVLEARWKILELSSSAFSITLILEATRLSSSRPGGKSSNCHRQP